MIARKSVTLTLTVIVLLVVNFWLFKKEVKLEFRPTTYTDIDNAQIDSLRSDIISAPTRETATETKKRKFFIAFGFGDQLTCATESLLELAALSKYGERNVVVPFAKNSKLYGTKLDEHTGTLSRYFDLKELNETLKTHGYGTMVHWEYFQEYCPQQLNVLLTFFYPFHYAPELSMPQKKMLNKTGWTKCSGSDSKELRMFEVRERICINPEVLTSMEKLEHDVLRHAPCVGIFLWRGIGPGRGHFTIPSYISPPSKIKYALHISPDLKQITEQFVAQQLGNDFVSVHIRSEWIMRDHGRSVEHVLQCLRQLEDKLKSVKNEIGFEKVFLATDFSKFGSDSNFIQPARDKKDKLLNALHRIINKPQTFDPKNIPDRGSIAIVEMSILASGKRLFLVGGGKFEKWTEFQYNKVNDIPAIKICFHKSL